LNTNDLIKSKRISIPDPSSNFDQRKLIAYWKNNSGRSCKVTAKYCVQKNPFGVVENRGGSCGFID